MIDVVFAAQGGPIPRDYAAPLHAQLAALLPWFDDETRAGIHPLRGTTPHGDALLLGPRTRLTLRVPAERAADCEALQDRALALPQSLRLGAVQEKPLLPYRTLYAALVVTGDADEEPFLAAVRSVMAAWDIVCQVIVGRAGSARTDATEPQRGFSLMLHGVTPEQSLLVQQDGVGLHRKFGCGLFIPHKSADAVGF
jgi:CRISPR-associated protein Cas6